MHFTDHPRLIEIRQGAVNGLDLGPCGLPSEHPMTCSALDDEDRSSLVAAREKSHLRNLGAEHLSCFIENRTEGGRRVIAGVEA